MPETNHEAPNNKSDENYYIPKPQISRRAFLKGGTVAVISALATAAVMKLGLQPQSESVEPVKPPSSYEPENTPAISELNFTYGNKKDLSLQEFGLSFTPDGHIPYFTTPEGKKRYFISSNISTYMVEAQAGQSLDEARESGQLATDSFKKVYEPDPNTPYRQNYVGITSVLQLDKGNPMHILGIAHCEKRSSESESGTYTATVGLAESFDGGQSWQDKGRLIQGVDTIEPGKRPTGAGQPAAIVKDGYAYIMYLDWSAQGKFPHPDQLYLARAKTNDNGSLGDLEYLSETGFSSFDPGKLKSVIPAENLGYIALPSLSFNEDLEKYLCIFETKLGFGESTSTDLVNWTQPNMFFKFDENNSQMRGVDLKENQEFLSYPSYLSKDSPTDQITKRNGKLFYSSRPQGMNSHNLKSADLSIAQ